MRRIFLVPKGLLDYSHVGASHGAELNDKQSLVVLHGDFYQSSYEDWFLAQPGVLELFPWDQQKPPPAELTDALATNPSLASRVTSVTTLKAALRMVTDRLW